MNPNNQSLHSESRDSHGRSGLLPFTVSGVGKYAIWLMLGLAVLSQSASAAPQLVGQWFTTNTLADVSGYPLASNHTAYAIGAGAYVFTNDVPIGKTGQSLVFLDAASGFAITNSSTLDTAYDN